MLCKENNTVVSSSLRCTRFFFDLRLEFTKTLKSHTDLNHLTDYSDKNIKDTF